MSDLQSNQPQPQNQPNNIPQPMNWMMPWWAIPWMVSGGSSAGMRSFNPWLGNSQNNQNGTPDQSVGIQNGENVQNSSNGNGIPSSDRVTVSCGIIEEENDIKPADVPMNGGFGMFMKKDLSTIFIKQWQSDGKIYTKKYVEVVEESPSTISNEPSVQDVLNQTNSRFEQIEDTISKLSYAITSMIAPDTKSRPTKKKTEVLIDE